MFSASIYLPDTLDIHDVKDLGQILEESALSHTSQLEKAPQSNAKRWVLCWFFENKPDPVYLSHILNTSENIGITADMWQIESVPEDINWLEHVYAQTPPIEAGPFFIYGSHHKENIPSEAITLNIDAITAFGSGDHGTTKGCLLAMADLKDQGICPWNVLDMGTGSGILAIAAWKLWKTPILGIDIEDEAINVCYRHAEQNNIRITPQDLSFAQGDGFNAAQVIDKKPFDLIIANILAGPLKEMATAMYNVSDENGYVILSGILNEQADSVVDSYKNAGFTLKSANEIGEWTTLVLQK